VPKALKVAGLVGLVVAVVVTDVVATSLARRWAPDRSGWLFVPIQLALLAPILAVMASVSRRIDRNDVTSADDQ
jgi:hypothetical protein